MNGLTADVRTGVVMNPPIEIQESMTLNRIQRIEKDILDLRDCFGRNLATVLMPSSPSKDADEETDNRTFLGRALTDVEIACSQLRSLLERITL